MSRDNRHVANLFFQIDIISTCSCRKFSRLMLQETIKWDNLIISKFLLMLYYITLRMPISPPKIQKSLKNDLKGIVQQSITFGFSSFFWDLR